MPSDRRALCVGINQFPFAPQLKALAGCVNDAHDMAGVLRDCVGFAAGDITILTDQQATKANIISALSSMVAQASAGGVKYLVFSLSSHGTQVVDFNNDEPDGKDEAFCAYNAAATPQGFWDPNTLIVDDELRDLFLKLPQDVLVEVYLDTCHSGAGLRGAKRVARYAPPPSPKAIRSLARVKVRGTMRGALRGDSRHHILWAACRDSQESFDAYFGGRPNGAFTYNWTKAMRESQNTLSRRQILERVREGLLAGNFRQEPQLQANATLT